MKIYPKNSLLGVRFKTSDHINKSDIIFSITSVKSDNVIIEWDDNDDDKHYTTEEGEYNIENVLYYFQNGSWIKV